MRKRDETVETKDLEGMKASMRGEEKSGGETGRVEKKGE